MSSTSLRTPGGAPPPPPTFPADSRQGRRRLCHWSFPAYRGASTAWRSVENLSDLCAPLAREASAAPLARPVLRRRGAGRARARSRIPSPSGIFPAPHSIAAQRPRPASLLPPRQRSGTGRIPTTCSCSLLSSARRKRGGCTRDLPVQPRIALSTSPRPVHRPAALASTCTHLAPFPNGSPRQRPSHPARCAQKRSAQTPPQGTLPLFRFHSADRGQSAIRRRLPPSISEIRAVRLPPGSFSTSIRRDFRRPVNRAADARVGPAAAYIPGHRFIDVFVRRVGFLAQQHRRAHDLPGLAIAALRNIQLDPGALQRVAQVGRNSLDGGHLTPRRARDRRHAGAH